jgi:hypothetical protein
MLRVLFIERLEIILAMIESCSVSSEKLEAEQVFSS